MAITMGWVLFNLFFFNVYGLSAFQQRGKFDAGGEPELGKWSFVTRIREQKATSGP